MFSGAGGVFRIAVLAGVRTLVLACSGGVYWSPIPRAGGAYSWKAARRLPGGAYSGLAIGPGGSVVAAAWGSSPDQGLCGLFHGAWSGGELVMRRCGYWVSLRGRPATTNQNTVTVSIPRAQMFHPESFCAIMIRIGQGGLP